MQAVVAPVAVMTATAVIASLADRPVVAMTVADSVVVLVAVSPAATTSVRPPPVAVRVVVLVPAMTGVLPPAAMVTAMAASPASVTQQAVAVSPPAVTRARRAVTRLLRPDRRDYFVLKPKHSGFYSTTLELLLEHFRARTLILTGLLADSCILFTAQDAHMRGYDVVVPPDCVAARAAADSHRALEQMRRALKADTRASTALDLKRLIRRAGRRV